jgi:hypothetical protein
VRDAVTRVDDGADLFPARLLRLVVGDEPIQGVPDLLRPDRELSHCDSCFLDLAGLLWL